MNTTTSTQAHERIAEIQAELLDIRVNYRIDGPSQRRRNVLLAEGRALVAEHGYPKALLKPVRVKAAS